MTNKTISITSLISRFWLKALLTWVLVLLEGLALVAMPLVIGWSVDGLLIDSWTGVTQLAGLCLILLIVGGSRRFYDTRAYSSIYRIVSEELVAKERKAGSPLSKTTARVNLFTEFIHFLEESLPGILHQTVGLFGTLVIIAMIDIKILIACLFSVVLIIIIYAFSDRRIYRLNRGSNDELERQVETLDKADEAEVGRHFFRQAGWQIKLSDLETFNYSLIWLVLTSVIIYTVVTVATSGQATTGQILAAVMYVFSFTENTLAFPHFYQEIIRLREISKRFAGPIKNSEHQMKAKNILPTIAITVVLAMTATCVLADSETHHNWMLSGTMSYNSQGGDAFQATGDTRTTRLYGTPSGGIFVNDKLALGLSSHLDFTSHGEDSSSSISAGPYAVWHFRSPDISTRHTNSWIPYLGLSWMWGNMEAKENGIKTPSIRFHMIRMDAGITFMLNDTIGLTLSVNRSFYNTHQTLAGQKARLTAEEWGIEYGVTAYLF